MKIRTIITLFALACIAFAMSSCATTTAIDGTVTKSLDPAATALAYQTALVALGEYQRQHPAHAEK